MCLILGMRHLRIRVAQASSLSKSKPIRHPGSNLFEKPHSRSQIPTIKGKKLIAGDKTAIYPPISPPKAPPPPPSTTEQNAADIIHPPSPRRHSQSRTFGFPITKFFARDKTANDPPTSPAIASQQPSTTEHNAADDRSALPTRKVIASESVPLRHGSHVVYIALGSNLGDRFKTIENACREMDAQGIRVTRTSSLYETQPMYINDQALFINGVCEVSHVPCLYLSTI